MIDLSYSGAIEVFDDEETSKVYRARIEKLLSFPNTQYKEPLTLKSLKEAIEKRRRGHIQSNVLLVGRQGLIDLHMSKEFVDYFDPVTKLERIHLGYVGSMFGMSVQSDVYLLNLEQPILDVDSYYLVTLPFGYQD